MRNALRKRTRRSENGAAALEFALVIAPMVFVLYALIAFGMMLAAKNGITHAAAEGARAAVGAADPVTAAQTRATQSVAWMGANHQPTITATTGSCPGSSSPTATCITVVVTYPYKDKPLVPAAPGLGLVTPDSFSSTAVLELTT